MTVPLSALPLWQSGAAEDRNQFVHAGLHYLAFEYDSFDDLMSSFARLKSSESNP